MLTHNPSKNLQLKLIASAFGTDEKESYDIQGQYWLYETQMGETEADSNLFDRGIGTYIEHARNRLVANIYNIEHKGLRFYNNGHLSWGLKYQYALISDRMNEWKMVDSAGTPIGTLPDIPGQINPQNPPMLQNIYKSFNDISSSRLSAFYERAGMMRCLNGQEGSVSIIGAVSPQGGDFSEPVTMNTKRFVRCFWGLDKSLAYARHFPAIHWLTSYSEYINDLAPWYKDHVNKNFVDMRNQLMAILNNESSLMEIVKLIGGDVLPDDQKLTLEIARVIRLGFLQQNAFHKDDTSVPLIKQYKMMETILYLYKKSKTLVTMGMPMSVLKEDDIFDKVISIKFDVPNDKLEMFDDYKKAIDEFYDNVLKKNG